MPVGGIAGYSKAMKQYKINKIVQETTHLATQIKTLYINQHYDIFGIAFGENILDKGIVSSNMVVEYEGEKYIGEPPSYIIDSIGYRDGNKSTFGISLVISPKYYLALATYDWKQAGALVIALGSQVYSGTDGLGIGIMGMNYDSSFQICEVDSNNVFCCMGSSYPDVSLATAQEYYQAAMESISLLKSYLMSSESLQRLQTS